jgi:bifunctional non-homologous end joining protein LigD
VAGRESTYDKKRKFDSTPEPPSSPDDQGDGDLDPLVAEPGPSFVIQQHYATALHHDFRLEMGRTDVEPVLVSWAVPKGLPRRRGTKALAIRTEDHPFAYGSFSGAIPDGNYGAGEVRIFDAGTYEIVKRDAEKITFRLEGRRLKGIYHLVKTSPANGKEQWLAILSVDERPQSAPLPPLDPMLATLVDDPFDDPAWLYEPKWDGVRALAICNETTRLVSRRGNDITEGYPELSALHDRLVALDAVIDGEIVAFEEGKPSFQKLQQRMHVRGGRQLAALVRSSPVAFLAFDLLYLDGVSLIDEPLDQRRRLLEETVVPNDKIQISPAVTAEGTTLYQAAVKQGLEGIVAKMTSSPYEPGKRSPAWLKIKTVLDLDAVVAGWTEGSGSRQDTLGSLVLALYQGDGKLRYIGNVGTGFNKSSLTDTMDRVRNLASVTAPFDASTLKSRPELRKAHWIEPDLVATVEYRELTNAGRLRAPSFKGLRQDKEAKACTVDQLEDQQSRR